MAHKLGPVFRRVVEHFSTKTALGEAVGLDRRTINNWSIQGWIPAEWVMAVSAATGGRISVVELLHEAALGKATKSAKREMARKLAAEAPKTDLFEGA